MFGIGGIMGIAQQIFGQTQQQQGGQGAEGAQGSQEPEGGPADTFQQALAHLYDEEQEAE